MTHRRDPCGDHPNRPFSVREALEHGLTPGRLRSGDLLKPFHGIRMPHRPVIALDDRCRAFLVRMPSEAVFSHATAALLYSMPLPLSVSSRAELHVSVPPPRRAVDAAGIVGHRIRLMPRDWDRRFGYPVTTSERTWCDLASELTLPELVAVGDKLIARRLPQTTPAELQRAVESYPSRRGVRALRGALPLLSERAESPRESLLRVTIVLAGLPVPEVNRRVFDSQGKFLGRVDLCYPPLKLSMEYQGDHHRTDQAQWRKDIARTRAFQAAGWTELQYTQDDIVRPEPFLTELTSMIDQLSQ